MAWQIITPGPAVRGAPDPEKKAMNGVGAMAVSILIVGFGVFIMGVADSYKALAVFWLISLLIYLGGGLQYAEATRRIRSMLPDQLALMSSLIRIPMSIGSLSSVSTVMGRYYYMPASIVILFLLELICCTIFIGISLDRIYKKSARGGVMRPTTLW